MLFEQTAGGRRMCAGLKCALLGCLLLFGGCSQGTQNASDTPDAENAGHGKTADLLIKNGRIYTGTAEQPWAQTLAVAAGDILAVGDSADLNNLIGPHTEVVDLHGRFVMPGVIDGHAHPAWGGLVASYYCLFAATALPDEIATTLSRCVSEAQPQTVWIQGGLWAADFFQQYQIESPRAWLDRISGNKAIALRDDSGHNYWLNSRALELLGLDHTSKPPGEAVFLRHADGTLNGVLLESFTLLTPQLPPWTTEHYRTGIAYAQANAHRHGVTGVKDASASDTEAQAYHAADQAGQLNLHVALCLYIQPEGSHGAEGSHDVDVTAYERMREKYRSARVHTNFVKIFLDGIPTTARTAAMLTPYVQEHEGQEEVFGPLHLSATALSDAMVALDAAGFTVKIHTAGDRSVHNALNAIATARRANDMLTQRHELAHAGFIAAEDIPRFAELQVVADLSPHLWFPSPIVKSVRTALGERGFAYWPNKDLLAAGAPMLMGSDWPSVAPDLNPWIGLEALVTRADPAHLYPGEGWREQALTVAEGIRIMTMGGARALGLEQRIGSLAVGKAADFIVLDQNLFDIAPQQISETRVLATYFAGQRVYPETAPLFLAGQMF